MTEVSIRQIKNKFPDNLTGDDLASLIVSWLDGEAINTVHSLNMCHKNGFFSLFGSVDGAIELSGLAPQKITDVTGDGEATRDTFQRKVFFDGTYFYAFFWQSSDKTVYYASSTDGITWSTPTLLLLFSVGPYYGGNVDVDYPDHGVEVGGVPIDLAITYAGSNGGTVAWRPYTKSAGVLTVKTGASQGGLIGGHGSRMASNFNARDFFGGHDSAVLHLFVRANDKTYDQDASLTHGGATRGGLVVLNYKTSAPYYMLVLAKANDSKLYWNTLTENGAALFLGSFIEIATLIDGFSDFCACTEAQNIGDPEIVHLVYVKSTGELCYRKFEEDAWGDEGVLVDSGVTYPVIAAGTEGRLYVFYVKDGKIWSLHYDEGWHGAVEFYTDEHTYDTPTYLSCSQNVQDGRVSLVWTEKSSSPYELWFSYLEED